jgi:hypothetical protein
MTGDSGASKLDVSNEWCDDPPPGDPKGVVVLTYSQFVQPVEELKRAATGLEGIEVVDAPTQPFFLAIVKEALSHLKLAPTGSALLSAIAAAAPKDDRGYKVLIQRVSISYTLATTTNGTTIKPSGGRSYASGAQERLGIYGRARPLQGQEVHRKQAPQRLQAAGTSQLPLIARPG